MSSYICNCDSLRQERVREFIGDHSPTPWHELKPNTDYFCHNMGCSSLCQNINSAVSLYLINLRGPVLAASNLFGSVPIYKLPELKETLDNQDPHGGTSKHTSLANYCIIAPFRYIYLHSGKVPALHNGLVGEPVRFNFNRVKFIEAKEEDVTLVLLGSLHAKS